MAESTAFKDGINRGVAEHYATALTGIVPGFDGDTFIADVVQALPELELKARVKHVAATLRAHLPEDYPEALAALMAAFDAEDPPPGAGFVHWPMAQFVQDYGVDHFDKSVAAMKRITRRFSCEFAVRPFLLRYPERMLAVRQWALDDDVHVRRNASEGIRPRLPWGMQLKAYIADPAPVIGVLELLRKDPEEYVRRSVSNCLNDIAKDHPALLMDTLQRWDADPDAHTVWIKTRALRTLIKAGEPRALELLGFGPPAVRVQGLRLNAASYRVGDDMRVSFTVVSESDKPQKLVLDYRVHFVKANGKRTAKVFKLKNMTLAPGARHDIVRKQHLKPISTRRYHAGTHAVDVQINGVVFANVEFELSL